MFLHSKWSRAGKNLTSTAVATRKRECRVIIFFIKVFRIFFFNSSTQAHKMLKRAYTRKCPRPCTKPVTVSNRPVISFTLSLSLASSSLAQSSSRAPYSTTSGSKVATELSHPQLFSPSSPHPFIPSCTLHPSLFHAFSLSTPTDYFSFRISAV